MDKCPDLPVIQMMLKVFFAALCAGFISMPVALALEIEGVKLDDSIEIAKGGPKLVLNGAGVRHKLAFVKVYVGSLYLQAKKSDSEAVFADTGAKRVTMHILANEVTAQDLVSSVNNALAVNLSPHELALVEKRIRDLNNMMSSIKTLGRGGAVQLDYLPDVGTRITVNGEEKITIPGADFFNALLHIWIGNKPVDGRLRDAMLGKGR
jgi:hypothetical protein